MSIIMTKKTVRGLSGSIKKWEKIVEGTGADFGHSNCPLCKIYIEDMCNGCPVYDKTGHRACKQTPYEEWVHHHASKHLISLHIQCPTCKKLAKKEVKFLKSLIPKGIVKK